MSSNYPPKIFGCWCFISTAWVLLCFPFSVLSVSAVKISELQQAGGASSVLAATGVSANCCWWNRPSYSKEQTISRQQAAPEHAVLNFTPTFPNSVILWDSFGSKENLLWQEVFCQLSIWGFYLRIIIECNPFRLLSQHLTGTLSSSQFKNICWAFSLETKDLSFSVSVVSFKVPQLTASPCLQPG